MMQPLLQILTVTLVAVPLIYGFHCLLARQWLRFEAYPLALYMAAAFLVMAVMEAGIGHLHTTLFGWRLWEYHLLPNHRNYGSYLGPLTWPWYGFHLYLLERVMRLRRWPLSAARWRGVITGVDGPLLEILGNGLFVLFFGAYVFYYFPGDLWHLSSLAVVPHYALAGLVLAVILRGLVEARPSWSLPAALYFSGTLFVLVG